MDPNIIELAVKAGKPPVLKVLYNCIKDTPYYDANFVATSVRLFNQLVTNGDKYESKSDEIIKRKIYPFLRCLVNRPDLFMIILDNYKELRPEARKVIDEKFDQLIQIVFNTKERIVKLLGGLINNIDEKNSFGFKEDTKLIVKIVNALKNKKNLGKIVLDIIVELFETKMSTFLNVFSNIDPYLVYQMIFKKYRQVNNLEDILTVYKIWGVNLSDFIIGLIFLTVPADDVSYLTQLLDQLVSSLIAQIDKRELNNKVINKINASEIKDIPLCAVYVILKIAEHDYKDRKPMDQYLEIFKKGILNQYYNNQLFWKYLLDFCRLDRILAEETISSLLPEDKRQEFHEDYRRIRR